MNATHSPATDAFDREHFLKKFEAIPDSRWCTGRFHHRGCSCVFGHCGVQDGVDYETGKWGILHTPESRALIALFCGQTEVIHINDGIAIHRKPGAAVAHLATPKQRILAALRAL